MAKKNFVRLDKVSTATHYESIVSPDSELIAGQLVNLGKVIDLGDREVVDFEKAKAGESFEAIVAPVYLNYGESSFDITEQSIKAGKPARAIILENGSVISINKELCDTAIKAGDAVEVNTDGLGFKKAASGTKVGKCIALETLTNVGELVVIRIMK